MYASSICVVFCSLIAIALAAPVLEDIFAGFVKNANLNSPPGKADVVKRRIYENRDAGLKQVSLQSLIGGLENSFFQSAISVRGVASNEGVVPEIRPSVPEVPITEHNLSKRKTDAQTSHEEATPSALRSSTRVGSSVPQGVDVSTEPQEHERKVILQTTEKVPESDGVPAHVLIDRISVQPHTGFNLPIIPAFQLHQTKVATIKENHSGPPTHITITKTDITGELATVATSGDAKQQLPPVILATKPATIIIATHGVDHATGTTVQSTTAVAPTESTTSTSPSSTTTSTTSTTTTKLPIVELKEAEKELKEKVAEIEADPVILSSRV